MSVTSTKKSKGGHYGLSATMKRFIPLYIMFIPVIIYYLTFSYAPMGGLVIAFKQYNFSKGIFGSDWVGFKHFKRFLNDPVFWDVLWNTIRLALKRILFTFPAPIILAILLNEVRHERYKKTIQTLVYLPHFLSWAIVYGFLYNFFSSAGAVNEVIQKLGGEAIPFLSSKSWYDTMFIGSAMWKEVGWGTIIYLAAIPSVNSELLEAAQIDGAGRFKRIWHVILPGIRNVISIQLIMSFGGILSVSFEQTLNLINDAVRPVAEVMDHYIYRIGILTAGNFSFSTAIGMFRNIISLILVLTTNKVVSLIEEDGALW